MLQMKTEAALTIAALSCALFSGCSREARTVYDVGASSEDGGISVTLAEGSERTVREVSVTRPNTYTVAFGYQYSDGDSTYSKWGESFSFAAPPSTSESKSFTYNSKGIDAIDRDHCTQVQFSWIDSSGKSHTQVKSLEEANVSYPALPFTKGAHAQR
jgi:hypothetical protein